MGKRKIRKLKPLYVFIEGNKLNEKTGLMESVKRKIKVKGCGI